MANYQGVCLTTPSWRFVNLDIASQVADHEDLSWETPLELGHLGRYFAPYLAVKSLATVATRTDRSVEASLRPQFWEERGELDRLTQNWELPDAFGVCHGHTIPRSIRPLLPLWFERWDETEVPVHCVAAPVAAVMAWVAAGVADFPLRCIITSGTNQVAEFSAVRAAVNDETLSIQMDWTCELTQDEQPAQRQAKLARMVRSMPGKAGDKEWRVDCFNGLPWIADCLRVLATEAAAAGVTLNGGPRMHDGLELARGAACHAAFQQTQQLPNAGFSRLEYLDVCVRDVGLICQGPQGQYWHTLFPTGQSLPATSSKLRLRGACPATFQLFEYTGDGIPPQWNNADEQFLKQLRWYGSGTLTAPKETPPERLVIQIPAGSEPDHIPSPSGEVS